MGERATFEWLTLDQQLREVTPIGRFAPGEYLSPCHDCGRRFMGDKRARQCFACAFKSVTAATESAVAVRDALENLIIAIGLGWDLDGVVAVANARLKPPPPTPLESSESRG